MNYLDASHPQVIGQLKTVLCGGLTDIQTDRHTDTQTDRQTHKHTDRQTDNEAGNDCQNRLLLNC